MKLAFLNFVNKTKSFVLDYPTRCINRDPLYYGVIVEFRLHTCFEYVCKNFLRFTNEDWGLHVFHGNKNKNFVYKSLKGVANVKYTNLNVDNISIEDYNLLLTNNDKFYNQIKSDMFLTFQTDSLFLQPLKDEFLVYDYIGAPWPQHNNKVGNGGFSIRCKKTFMEISNNFNRPSQLAEDVFHSDCLIKMGANVAPYSIAKNFSCECEATNTLPIGCHDHINNVHVPNLYTLYRNYFR